MCRRLPVGGGPPPPWQRLCSPRPRLTGVRVLRGPAQVHRPVPRKQRLPRTPPRGLSRSPAALGRTWGGLVMREEGIGHAAANGEWRALRSSGT